MRSSMKRAFRFGLSAGCMLGGMLGVYDAFRPSAGQTFNLNVGMKNMLRSVPYGLLTMGG